MKKLLIAIIAVLFLGMAYYFISPLWRVVELDDASPISDVAGDDLAKMMEEMKDEVVEMDEPKPDMPRLVASGDFLPKAHVVEGKAILIENGGERTLRFEDFETVNGPDLFIYLATDETGSDFVDLGRIKATKGNINYDVPLGTDTDKYNKVLVWCRAFRVLFSLAELE